MPPIPPDSFPSDYKKSWDPAWDAPRDLVAVIFHPGTTVEQKTEAIAAIGGCVVGGARTQPGSVIEGYYLVRIRDDGTMEPALQAISKVDEFPFVLGAHPLTGVTVDNTFEPAH